MRASGRRLKTTNFSKQNENPNKLPKSDFVTGCAILRTGATRSEDPSSSRVLAYEQMKKEGFPSSY